MEEEEGPSNAFVAQWNKKVIEWFYRRIEGSVWLKIPYFKKTLETNITFCFHQLSDATLQTIRYI